MTTTKTTLSDRLAAAVAEFWRGLPQPARDVLTPGPPVIACQPTPGGDLDRPLVAVYLPTWVPGGERIEVEETAKELPFPLLVALVAHEHAHCYYHRAPREQHFSAEEEEELADAKAEAWGWPIKALRHWYGWPDDAADDDHEDDD